MRYLVLIALIAFGGHCKPKEAESGTPDSLKTGMEGQALPRSITMLPLDSSASLSINEVGGANSYVLLYFSPSCPYSKAEIQDIVKHGKDHEETQFILLTPFTIKEAKAISDEFKLQDHNNIRIGIDKEMLLAKHYKIQGVPFIAVYDRQKRLKVAYGGAVNFNEIAKNL